MLNKAQQMYELGGDVQDTWASFCPETENEGNLCEMPKRKTYDNVNTDSIPELETSDHTLKIAYTVIHQNTSKEEIFQLLRSLNYKQSKIFYHLRE